MNAAVSNRELDDLVLQLKGLVLVRALLEGNRASDAEIDAHTAEINRVRARLARESGPERGRGTSCRRETIRRESWQLQGRTSEPVRTTM
jgi:hypothetical protein